MVSIPGLEHASAALRESVNRGHKNIEALEARAEAGEAATAELGRNLGDSLNGHEERVAGLEQRGEEQHRRLGGLDEWRKVTNGTLDEHKRRLDGAHDGVEHALSACDRLGDETRHHKLSLDGAMQVRWSVSVGKKNGEENIAI